jgi:hypothetical protein
MFKENKNVGVQLSAKVGGVGYEACAELEKMLADIFKEWRKEWAKKGLLPKRKKRQ